MSWRVSLAGLALLALVGCSEKTQQQVESTGQAVVAEVKENAGQAVQATKDAAAGAEVTAKVKSALLASSKIEHGALNVDTVDNTVYLRGYVPTLEQRSLADEIAKNTVAQGTTVINELAVGTPTPAPLTTATPDPASSPGTITDEVNETPPAHDGHDHEGHDHDHAPGEKHTH